MLFIKLDTMENVSSLTKLNEKYKKENDIVVDVSHGRYIIDGCSLLAVISLLGNIVKVIPITDDNVLLESFKNDLEKIGGFDSEEVVM